MLPDLEQLIRLQKLETSAADAHARIDEVPKLRDALEQRIADCKTAVETAQAKLAEHRTARAAVEKEVAEVQSRLSRFKEQLMAVKTNKEYHAMQSEIGGAERDIQVKEDRLLERMMEADDLADQVTVAERLLGAEEKTVSEERAVLDAEHADLTQRLAAVDAERQELAGHISADIRDLFDVLTRGRKGTAVVEARLGLCTSCRVRLRPQLFNQLRANATIIQCESCQRILYFVESRPPEPAPKPAPEEPTAPPDA